MTDDETCPECGAVKDLSTGLPKIEIWLVWVHDENGVALRAVDTNRDLAMAHKRGIEASAQMFDRRERATIEHTEANHAFAYESLETMRRQIEAFEKRQRETPEVVRGCETCDLQGKGHEDCGEAACVKSGYRDWQPKEK